MPTYEYNEPIHNQAIKPTPMDEEGKLFSRQQRPFRVVCPSLEPPMLPVLVARSSSAFFAAESAGQSQIIRKFASLYEYSETFNAKGIGLGHPKIS